MTAETLNFESFLLMYHHQAYRLIPHRAGYPLCSISLEGGPFPRQEPWGTMPLSTVQQGHKEGLKGWYLLREFASCQVQERLQTVLLSLGVKGRTAGTSVVSQSQEKNKSRHSAPCSKVRCRLCVGVAQQIVLPTAPCWPSSAAGQYLSQCFSSYPYFFFKIGKSLPK